MYNYHLVQTYNYVKYFKITLLVVIATIISDVFRLISWVPSINFDSLTYFFVLLNYLSIGAILLITIKSVKDQHVPSTISSLFYAWLLWNFFNVVRGGLLASSYWDWKFLLLTSVGFSFISLVFFLGNNLFFTRKIIIFYVKYMFVFGFLFIPFSFVTNPELYSRLMIPVTFLILFIPYVQPKWKWLIALVAIASVFLALDFRTNIIKIALSIVLLSIYLLRKYVLNSWLIFIHILLFIIPLTLFFLGVTGSFNIFSDLSSSKSQKIVLQGSQGNGQELTNDTRTFLYDEVLSSMNTLSDWIIGKSASGSYHSEWFYNNGGAMEGKRYRSEVNILNILLYHGIVGVLIYFILLYTVSLIAIKNSNNTLAKMLGLVIASRWTLSFIEEFTQFDLNFFFFWLLIGLVSSAYFRSLSDSELKKYLRF